MVFQDTVSIRNAPGGTVISNRAPFPGVPVSFMEIARARKDLAGEEQAKDRYVSQNHG